MRVLVIEDDQETADYLRKGLAESGHVADHAGSGPDGLGLALGGGYDVLIIDRMLPGMDGLSLIRVLREEKVATPVLILSALGQVNDRVRGLRAGGDDYLVKPFAFAELLARLEALARRASSEGQSATRLRVGDLDMDLLGRTVTRAGKPIELQPRDPAIGASDAPRRPSRDPHDVARGRLGLSLRSANERHRRTYQPPAREDRHGLQDTAAAHRTWCRVLPTCPRLTYFA
jgi:CheY-like chemotaxis protein